MKLRVTNSHSHHGESTALRRLPWDADNTTSDGPTSLDILLMWLTTPGKYERLHSGKRAQAVQNLLGSLKLNGIEHCSDGGIRCKIRSIEDQYLTAKFWLQERNIDGDDVVNGEVDEDTAAEVLALCTHYCELMPVFRHSSYLNEMVPVDESAADVDPDPEDAADFDNKSRSAKQKRKRGKQAQRPKKQRQRSDGDRTRDDEAHGMDNAAEDCTDLVAVPCRSGQDDAFSPEFKRSMEKCKLEYAQKSSHLILQTERQKKECSVAIAQYREHCHVQAERQQNDVERRRSEMLLKADTQLLGRS